MRHPTAVGHGRTPLRRTLHPGGMMWDDIAENGDDATEILLERLRITIAELQAENIGMRDLIRDDFFASSFQTLGQYRAALLHRLIPALLLVALAAPAGAQTAGTDTGEPTRPGWENRSVWAVRLGARVGR
jgi:hypothetical protein